MDENLKGYWSDHTHFIQRINEGISNIGDVLHNLSQGMPSKLELLSAIMCRDGKSVDQSIRDSMEISLKVNDPEYMTKVIKEIASK